MPAIVLRISFERFSGKIFEKSEVLEFLAPKLKAVGASIFAERLKKIFVWEKGANRKVKIIMKRVLGTYALGDLGETTTLGIFDSTYPDYVEFWICSSQPAHCIKGRKCLQKSLPSIKNGIIRKTESDNLLLEGGAQIAKEGILSKYVRSSFNIGFLVSTLITTLTSVYSYFSTPNGQFNYQLPLFLWVIWIMILIGEIIYHRGRGVYVVKE